jgi:hypothetical protein
LGEIAEVGEEGTEGIIKGIVIPHGPWEELKRLGLVPTIGLQGGDDFFQRAAAKYAFSAQRTAQAGMTGFFNRGGPYQVATQQAAATTPGGGFGGGGGGAGGAAAPASVVDIVEEVQQAAAQESAALVASIPAATSAAASEQSARLVEETTRSNQNLLLEVKGMRRELAKFNQTLPVLVRDAVEKVR